MNGDPSDDDDVRHHAPIEATAPFLPRTFHVEVEQRAESLLPRERITHAADVFVRQGIDLSAIGCGSGGGVHRVTDFHEEGHQVLRDHVVALEISEDDDHLSIDDGGTAATPAAMVGTKLASLDRCRIQYHVFKLDRNGCHTEDMNEGDQEVHAATNWLLPSLEFTGQWESLIYDSDIKRSLLSYVETTMLFSQHNIDPNLISWNRVVLLHGPPGTGKTSLCRALAQKVAIRMSDRFKFGQLIEINSHSLFSKWFSESGKLVQRMFETIQDLVADPDVLVCVLIDEVESLAAARKSSGNEPSDAIRVVNAVLTQIDSLKRSPNVLILTTSNITGSIDLAFVDRADLKKFIGLPSVEAVYTMLLGSIGELVRKGLLEFAILWPFAKLREERSGSDSYKMLNSDLLLQISQQCQGFSGRTIRKLPFLAFTKLMRCPPVTMEKMMWALKVVATEQRSDVESMAG